MALLTCRDLTVHYGGLLAVDRVSFAVEPGDMLFILGDNGSGKTTLVRALLGLLPVRAGEILYEGIRPDEIGYLPQQTAARRDFPASVWEVVLSGCAGRRGWHPFYTAGDRRRAAAALERLGSAHLAGRCFCELSGGERQRVLLARALCAAEKLLLLDEPASALDPEASAELYRMAAELNREDGVAVIMVSHDLEAARRYAKTILRMDTAVQYFGAADGYFARLCGGGQSNG